MTPGFMAGHGGNLPEGAQTSVPSLGSSVMSDPLRVPSATTILPDRAVVWRDAVARSLSTTKGARRVLLAVALATFLLAAWHAGQTYFRSDEWAYWTFRRDLLNAGGLENLGHFFFSPHGGSPDGGAIPAGLMLIWLPLDLLFGMNSYLPYALPSALLHAAAGILLFELLGRWLRPVVALVASGLFLILGNAASGIAYGWLVNFIAPLAILFAALYAFTRLEGRNDRALIWITLGSALIATGFGAVGFVVTAVMATAYSMRKRFLTAVVHLATVIGVFAVWRLAYEPPGVSAQVGDAIRYLEFMWRGLTTATGDMVGVAWMPVGALVLIAAFVGAVWSWLERDPAVIVNVSTVTGAVLFYAMVAVRGVDLRAHSFSYDQDRYLYIAAALLLPSIAWLANRLISVRSWTSSPMVLLVLWAVPLNVGQTMDSYDDLVALGRANRVTIETAASLVGHLDSLEAGFLVADRSARFTATQFELLHEQGKVPCTADFDLAVAFAQGQGMPSPSPDQVACP